MMVSLRQNGVGHDKTCADAFLPKGHSRNDITGGDDRWYKTFVPLADKLYDEHLAQLEKEGLL
jgi:hypothetical protein